VDGLRTVEGESLVHLATFKMAGLAAGLKDGKDLGLKVDLRCCGLSVGGLRGGGSGLRLRLKTADRGSRPGNQGKPEDGH
jgi:hypothetical protein